MLKKLSYCLLALLHLRWQHLSSLWYSAGSDLVLLVLKLVSLRASFTRPGELTLTYEGTVAAAIQSALGPIPAKSAFAILQSAGMGGHGLIIVKIIAAGGAFMGICPAVAASLPKAMKEEKCEHGDDEQTEYSILRAL